MKTSELQKELNKSGYKYVRYHNKESGDVYKVEDLRDLVVICAKTLIQDRQDLAGTGVDWFPWTNNAEEFARMIKDSVVIEEVE